MTFSSSHLDEVRLPGIGILALLILLAVPALLVESASGSQMNDTIELQILAFNDLHGQLEPPASKLTVYYNSTHNPVLINAGGIEYLAAHIKRLRAESPNTIVVSAGDSIGASPLISSLFHDQPTIEALNMIGLDYSAVGNHELDEGIYELCRIQKGLCHPADGCFGGRPYSGAGFGYLAANIVNETNGALIFPPYKIRFVEGIPVGFIGIALKDTPTLVSPSAIKGLKFLDEAESIKSCVSELNEKGVRTIIVLIHNGDAQDGLLNESINLRGPISDLVNCTVDGVDVFITGHTHEAYNALINGRLVTQAGSNGMILTNIDLVLSRESGAVVSARAENIAVSNDLPGDTAVAALVDKYRAMAAPKANVVIGSITENITRSPSTSGEVELGCVVADSQLYDTASSNGAVVAFMNPGGIRGDLIHSQISGGEKPGQVTYSEAYMIEPFGNCLITMNLTGIQIDALLEQQFGNPLVGKNRILQVSEGFSYAWDESAPCGNKVEISSIMINGTAIDPDRQYPVTVNSFLADGGDNFTVLREGTDRRGGSLDLDALIEYFTARSPISPASGDRITVA